MRSYSSPHFPAFRVNTEILRKMRTRITPNIDNFYVVRTGKTNQKCLKVLTKNITFNHFHPNIHFAKNVVFQANLKILPILCLKLYQSREMKQKLQYRNTNKCLPSVMAFIIRQRLYLCFHWNSPLNKNFSSINNY